MIQSNFWSRFNALLPKNPKTIGDIQVVVGHNQFVVALLGGGSVLASSSDTALKVGDRVFVQGGVITGKQVGVITTVPGGIPLE